MVIPFHVLTVSCDHRADVSAAQFCHSLTFEAYDIHRLQRRLMLAASTAGFDNAPAARHSAERPPSVDAS